MDHRPSLTRFDSLPLSRQLQAVRRQGNIPSAVNTIAMAARAMVGA
jgi:hypothetical protein